RNRSDRRPQLWSPAMPSPLRPACVPLRHIAFVISVAGMLVASPAIAHASSTGGAVMPWTAPLQSLLDNLSGPTARILGAIAFVVGGALWAFTRHEEGA